MTRSHRLIAMEAMMLLAQHLVPLAVLLVAQRTLGKAMIARMRIGSKN